MEPYYEECVARLTDAQNKAASAGYQGVQFERSITPVYHYYNKKVQKRWQVRKIRQNCLQTRSQM